MSVSPCQEADHTAVVQQLGQRPHTAVRDLVVEAQVEIVTKVRKRVITFQLPTPEPCCGPPGVNPTSAQGQPRVNLGSIWGQSGVKSCQAGENPGSIRGQPVSSCGQPGVNPWTTRGQPSWVEPAAPYLVVAEVKVHHGQVVHHAARHHPHLAAGSSRTSTRPTLDGRKAAIGPRVQAHTAVWPPQTDTMGLHKLCIHPEFQPCSVLISTRRSLCINLPALSSSSRLPLRLRYISVSARSMAVRQGR